MVAESKMIELPPGGNHFWYVSTGAGNDRYFRDVRSKIKYKSMKPSSEPNRWRDTKHDPIKREQYKRLDTLQFKSTGYIKTLNSRQQDPNHNHSDDDKEPGDNEVLDGLESVENDLEEQVEVDKWVLKERYLLDGDAFVFHAFYFESKLFVFVYIFGFLMGLFFLNWSIKLVKALSIRIWIAWY